MSIDLNDEIMQDFLVEAGEILEMLNAELVDLEQSPEDVDMLNSIFRGFHTIKGGASFLSLTNLVEVCHKAEDVFNLLRNRELALDAQMMDTFLRVLDEVNHMFAQIRAGEEPQAAPPELIAELLAMQARPAPAADSASEADPPVRRWRGRGRGFAFGRRRSAGRAERCRIRRTSRHARRRRCARSDRRRACRGRG